MMRLMTSVAEMCAKEANLLILILNQPLFHRHITAGFPHTTAGLCVSSYHCKTKDQKVVPDFTPHSFL